MLCDICKNDVPADIAVEGKRVCWITRKELDSMENMAWIKLFGCRCFKEKH